MVGSVDEQRLKQRYPALERSGVCVEGVIAFTATYDASEDRFFNWIDGCPNSPDGTTLSGQFRIRIEDRTDRSISKLPALFVEDIDPIPDRHFSQADKSACLCSPLEEAEFLEPDLSLLLFIDRLVIPFLFGQLFYSQRGCWPWQEYAHGAAGVLEAYFIARDSARAAACLQLLAVDNQTWPKVKAALRQNPYVKGHTPCCCRKGDKIRRCHPRALQGLLQLQRDICALNLQLP